jgi:hypothetical protein
VLRVSSADAHVEHELRQAGIVPYRVDRSPDTKRFVFHLDVVNDAANKTALIQGIKAFVSANILTLQSIRKAAGTYLEFDIAAMLNEVALSASVRLDDTLVCALSDAGAAIVVSVYKAD